MGDPIETRLRVIAAKLHRLEAIDRNREVFGAGHDTSGHKYRREPPIKARDLAAIEGRIGCELPEELRAFVTRLHSAGAGPNYGLIAPAGSDACREAFPFSRNQALENLAQRRLADHEYDLLEFREDDEGDFLRGCMELSDAGCGWSDAIVLAGELRGTVWSIGEGASPTGRRLEGFFDWYERWLDQWLAPAALPTRLAEIASVPKDTRGLRLTNEASPTLPPSIQELTAIEVLVFERAGLTALPGWIAELRGLKSLSLDHNALVTLPEELFTMHRLEHLSIWKNGIDALPERIAGLQSLRELNLAGNRLRSLPAALTGLVRLETIDLRGNPVPREHVDALRAAIPGVRVLFD